MYTITGGGAFTAKNISDINSNFGELSGGGGASGVIDVYVNSQSGSNANNGLTPTTAKATIAGCAGLLRPGVRIGITGVLFEEYSTPNVANVSLIGLGNLPLQGTTSGAPNGGGATWLSPSGGSGILLKVNGQGWLIQNIYFNNSAAQPCIQFMRSGTGDPPLDPDGSHGAVIGCKFTGADAGIQISGGLTGMLIAGNEFSGFSGSGDCGLEVIVGAGVGTNIGFTICNNWFYNNANHFIGPLSNGQIYGNNFTIVGSATTCTIAMSLTGGASNSVYNNIFNRPINSSPNATLYVGGTNDTWGNNVGTDAIFWGVPDNS